MVGLRRLGRRSEAEAALADLLADDPLDAWGRHLAGQPLPDDPTTLLDVALEHAAVGETAPAVELLRQAAARPGPRGQRTVAPLAYYHLARVLDRAGEDPGAALDQARRADATHCLAATLDDVDVLTWATTVDPGDPRAHGLLGSWCYHHGQHDRAEQHWTVAATAPDPVTERNLGVLAWNARQDPDGAEAHYRRARELAPHDASLLSEHDQLAERRAVPVPDRLAALAEHPGAVVARDDLAVSWGRLLVLDGRAGEAVNWMRGRRFQPWEGGEGQVLAAWEAACLVASAEASADEAVRLVAAALKTPESLGEARHPLSNPAHVWLALGDARKRAGDAAGAEEAWREAAHARGDFQEMAPTEHSEATWFSVVAARRLGDEALASALVEGLDAYIRELRQTRPTIDYFATSLPTMRLFRPDLQSAHDDRVTLLAAQLEQLRSGRTDEVERLRVERPAEMVLTLMAAVRV